MLYDINGKAVNVIVKDEQVKLPESLRRKILENFENMRKSGANIWNGNLLCVSDVDIGSSTVNLICKKVIMLIICMENTLVVLQNMSVEI